MKFDLRIFRKQKGLTQKQVAEFLGIGQSFVSQMERGKDATPKETIAKLIDKFGDNIDTIGTDRQFFCVKVKVELSPTFYAWLFQYQGEICIQSPQNAIDQFVQMGETIIEVHS